MPRALGTALLAFVAALAAGAAAFFSGVEISGEFLRPRIERALSGPARASISWRCCAARSHSTR